MAKDKKKGKTQCLCLRLVDNEAQGAGPGAPHLSPTALKGRALHALMTLTNTNTM